MSNESKVATRKSAPKTNNGLHQSGMFDSLYLDIAIDLGTANTLIYQRNRGITLNEPSIVALNGKGEVAAFGHQALLMHEKTHKNLKTVHPLKYGVIADFGVAEMMIRELVKAVRRKWYTTTRNMFICVPNGITNVERMAVRDCAKNAGAKKVYLVEETVAAAVGIGLDVNQPVGNMIVDIGGGTTEIAVISLGGIVYSESVRIGGVNLNEDIISYFRRSHNLLIGNRTAEKIKCQIGSASPLENELEMIAKGRDLVSGFPKTRVATSADVRTAIAESVNTFVETVTKSLEQTPPELAADILDLGIKLSGGGALLRNLDKLIEEATDLPVHVTDDPLTAVVRGTGMIMEDFERYRNLVT